MGKKKPTGQKWHFTLGMSKYTRRHVDDMTNKETLKEIEEQFKAGDRTAILKGVAICAHGKLEFPDWLLREVNQLYYLAEGRKVESLDDFLGYKRPPGINLASFERDQRLRDEVYSAVLNAHNLQGAPLTRKSPNKSAFAYAAEHFEVMGKKISERNVEEIYQDEKKRRKARTPK